MHDRSADHQDNAPAGDDNERVGEELCAGIVLNIIPGSMERGEDVYKKQRIGEYKYQKEGDIVFCDIIIRYFFLQHLSLKKGRQR